MSTWATSRAVKHPVAGVMWIWMQNPRASTLATFHPTQHTCRWGDVEMDAESLRGVRGNETE